MEVLTKSSQGLTKYPSSPMGRLTGCATRFGLQRSWNEHYGGVETEIEGTKEINASGEKRKYCDVHEH